MTREKDTDAVKRWDTCTPMFIASMSTIAKLWKETRCASTDAGADGMVVVVLGDPRPPRRQGQGGQKCQELHSTYLVV